MRTYNLYLMEEAQKQTTNEAIQVYKVRRPRKGEEVVKYINLSEVIARETYTESCEVKGE